MISPLLANIYLHVLDIEFAWCKRGELVRYADDGVVLCRSMAQARAALGAIGEILGGCPLTMVMESQIQTVLSEEGTEFAVEWEWLPSWRPHDISADGREQLRAIGFSAF